MPAVTVTLMGKPGCHLCDDARAVVTSTVEGLREQGASIEFVEQSILDDPALESTFSDDIPVVFIGDEFHAQWRIDAAALRSALLRATS